MDEVIFREFKGTGNMEFSRQLADKKRIFKRSMSTSGTRREGMLMGVDRTKKVNWRKLRHYARARAPKETQRALELVLPQLKKDTSTSVGSSCEDQKSLLGLSSRKRDWLPIADSGVFEVNCTPRAYGLFRNSLLTPELRSPARMKGESALRPALQPGCRALQPVDRHHGRFRGHAARWQRTATRLFPAEELPNIRARAR
jgi:hypothetical protein